MKRTFQSIAVITFAVLAIGCASELQERQNAAAAAGFKIMTPQTPDQAAILPTLPADKVTQVNYHGKTYFVLPDVKNNQAYVGGPKEYQAYRQLRAQQQISDAQLEAAQMNQMAAMNMNAWGGWGMVGPMGGYYGGFRR
jgi:hypothetical protein